MSAAATAAAVFGQSRLAPESLEQQFPALLRRKTFFRSRPTRSRLACRLKYRDRPFSSMQIMANVHCHAIEPWQQFALLVKLLECFVEAQKYLLRRILRVGFIEENALARA
jgi:hypothetical protein